MAGEEGELGAMSASSPEKDAWTDPIVMTNTANNRAACRQEERIGALLCKGNNGKWGGRVDIAIQR